ncbi:MAG TPA: biopolymer transporter Tol, partial [Bacteroidetes bacterium]|nr:biopolymer transporter Tol [Bacteroidota bacterium]
MRRFLFSVLLVVFLPLSGIGQPQSYNHPELQWFTITTEHFQVHYHLGAERTAREVARVAEKVYGPITRLYHYKDSDVVHFIVRDHDDYSNGITYPYDKKIEIWATPMDFDLRGTHPWLLNVVTHEYTHVISIDRAKKFGDKIPGLFVQYISYEKEKRPDVLYGFPNRIVSVPIAGEVLPPWFAEGVAQFQAPDEAYDFWDTHRDMILRM